MGSLANAVAAESLPHAKLFVNVVKSKYAGKKFSKLRDLGLILESGSVRSITQWKNWRFE